MNVARCLCASLPAVGAAFLLSSGIAHAQSPGFMRDCQSWIEKKGYSVDYIEQKLGKRQPGFATMWRGNVPLKDVQPGDVLLIHFSAPGALHAALVEEVRRLADGTVEGIRVSEWNWGRMVDRRCFVTENFGRPAPPRWVDPEAVEAVWRPSLPL